MRRSLATLTTRSSWLALRILLGDRSWWTLLQLRALRALGA